MFQSLQPLSYKLRGEYESGKSAGHSSCSGSKLQNEIVAGNRTKWKRGANGNDSFLSRLIQGACIAHMQSSVTFLDFPRLCKHERKISLCGSHEAAVSHSAR